MSHGITVKDLDVAGGRQIASQSTVRIGGKAIVLRGDPVEPHAPFVPLHVPSPRMAEGHPRVRINGVPICREGHLANCGHPTTGRPKVRISS